MADDLTPRERAVGDALRPHLPDTVRLVKLREEGGQIVEAEFKFSSDGDMLGLAEIVSNALDAAFRIVDEEYVNETSFTVRINRA